MDETNTNLEPQPSSAPPLTDEEREAEMKKIEEELKHDEEVKEAKMHEMLEKAKEMREKHQKTLLLEMIELARALNGYNYISASMLTSVPEDNKTYSQLLQKLLLGFMLSGGKNIEDFKKIYVGTGVVFLQAHKELPTLGPDGLYSGFDPDRRMIKTITNLKQLVLCSDPKDFKPVIIARTGRDKDGKLTFGKLEGDPYHQFTPEEIAAVLKKGEEEQASREKQDA
jgi:hypothetical protein